jgi:hypothetical protein
METPIELSAYHRYKLTQDRWRTANQAKINEYYRIKRALNKPNKIAEKNKQIALKYIAENPELLN